MTDIEIRRDQQVVAVPDQPTLGIDLEVWARQATAAAVYAEGVCRTQMVPKAYYGKPEEAAAAILKGAELGFSPMASLNAFDNIGGTPAPKALTLRAVVTGAGHDIETVEQSAIRAVVRGRRKGRDTWQTSTWDIERAQRLPQFKSNPNYANNPEAMLVARATAEVCRWVAPDAIMGVPYAAEELDGPAYEPAPPVARRITAAELNAPPAEDAAPQPGPEPDQALAIVYRDQIADRHTTVDQLLRIRDELRKRDLADVVVVNETGDEEALLTMCQRIGRERSTAGGEQ
jgi:hypothetical protein